MVAMWGALIGLTLGISVGTLGICACDCMESVICLLSLVWGMGMFVGACTLGTRYVIGDKKHIVTDKFLSFGLHMY
jgi:hypothetical protein